MASEPQPSFSPGRKWFIGSSVVAGVVAALAIVIMLNYISRNFFFRRLFLSTQTRIELSPQTLGLLKTVTNHVKVTLYYDKEEPMFPTISALVNEYHLANPRIAVETVDYTRNAALAQGTKLKYKLDGATDKNLIIFDCTDYTNRVKHVPGAALTEYTMEAVANAQEREFRKKPVTFNGETMCSAMLLAVTSPKPLRACYLVGHGENDAGNQKDETGYAKFAILVLQNYVSIEPLQLLGTNTIPADCGVLIIAGPKTRIPDIELDKIQDYLDEGGRLLAMPDCTSVTKETGLEPLLARWGVTLGQDIIKDEQHSTRGQDGQDIVISSFSRHTVVNALQQSAVHVILPRVVSAIVSTNSAADAPRVDELAFTGPGSTLLGQTNTDAKPYPIAVAVEKGAVAGVANERGTTRIVVVGESLFLGNQMIDSAANRDFASLALNWLLDRTQLMQGIGPRPVTESTMMLTNAQLKSVQLLLLLALPGAVMLTGLLVWLRRRN